MSLMLKGIDLPKKGELLTVNIDGNGYVFALTVTNEDKVIDHEVDVIQIPKDHGNIIDESKAVVTETIDGYYEITAPTILEAEESK